MSKKTHKEKAIGYVMAAMKEIVENLALSSEPADVKINAEAMLHLAEAYEKIDGTSDVPMI